MFIVAAVGVFGLIVGSFLNVMILRYGERGLGGRSACMTCHRILGWHELVPVVSWVALRGRCATCKARISAQYPLVEAATGALFALIAASFGARIVEGGIVAFALLCAYCMIVALLIAITVYDIRHLLIPDPWVYAFAVIALAIQLPFSHSVLDVALLIAAGPLAALPLFLIWFVSGGAWMGFGDVKLALGMGWLLGPFAGVPAVLFGFMLGGFFAMPLLVLSSPLFSRSLARVTPSIASRFAGLGFTMKSEVPFGPFLIASTLIIWISLLYGVTIPLVL